MATWHRAFILDNLRTLMKSIEPSATLYADLVQKGIITTNHIQRFELPKPADTKKMDFVLFFQHRPREHWESFIDALHDTEDPAYDTVYTLWKNYDPTQGVQGRKFLKHFAHKETKSPAALTEFLGKERPPSPPKHPSPLSTCKEPVYADFRLRPRRANQEGVEFYNDLHELQRCLCVKDILGYLISEDIVDIDDNERWCSMFRPNATRDFFLKMKMHVESGKYDEAYLLNTIAKTLRKTGNAHLVKYL